MKFSAPSQAYAENVSTRVTDLESAESIASYQMAD